MWDAVIAGAGPAGAVAAAILARAGRRVLLADKVNASAHKLGETLPGAAARLLRALDLPAPAPEGPHASIAGMLSAWGSDELVATDAIRDPYGPGWRLDRRRFDAGLRDAALTAGATERLALVRDIAREDDGWRLRFDDGGEAHARWLVDASGRSARLARKIGATRQRDSRLIALYRVGEASADFRESRTLIEATPQGWWYAARLASGEVIAGLHTHAVEARRIKAEPDAWRRALATARRLGPLLASIRFTQTLPTADAGGARLSRFHGERWIACGDAALAFAPISGQGIFSAIHCGMAAGQAVDAAIDGDSAMLAAYAGRLEEVWAIYRARRVAVYASEQRWPASPFWAGFRQTAAA